MQQPETQLVYWAPSRVRFNLTLILAVAVILFGLYQLVTDLRAGDPPPVETPAPAQTPGGQAEQPEQSEQPRRSGGGAYLLIIVGLGVGGYSWLTGPRQYRVYSDALVIMFGTPRSRQLHFSQIREVVSDRGFMGDPLRVYTSNRRRIAIQVRDPETFQQYLQSALDEFRRAHPEFAPPPMEDDAAGSGEASASADVVDSTAAEPADPPFTADETEDSGSSGGDRPSRSSRRRSLRDEDYDSNRDDSKPRFS
jgi:hypothetical protein